MACGASARSHAPPPAPCIAPPHGISTHTPPWRLHLGARCARTRWACTCAQALDAYARADPGATTGLQTRAGADCVRAHIIPRVVRLAELGPGTTGFVSEAGTALAITKA